MPWGSHKDNAWEKFENYSPTPYQGGFNPNIISRKRERDKEMSGSPFSAVIPNDVWKNRASHVPSIRSHKSLQVNTLLQHIAST